eukprot:TRINITY_DN914_c0_g1_i8.p1 TRINITY_DN914_c0_g1~~TRINITY_DN914_c0_g1_i8.p1  ORF type:complete len:258 (-),score=75.85 TRINITY_DN914_c0_g1_i8:4-777(-)
MQRSITFFFFFFSSRRRHTRCREVSWARRCVQETVSTQSTWDMSKHQLLEGYVKDVLKAFANDERVLMWDLYNEPGNGGDIKNKHVYSLDMLQKVFGWAREVNPSQPIISAVWTGDWSQPDKLSDLNKFMLYNSDLIVFHNYGNLNSFKHAYESLKQYDRPIICNEYMARPGGSTFQSILPFMKENKIGALNWGFVSGKTQTIYPWDSWHKKYTEEPPIWFHDIFRPDGSPFDEEETKLITKLTHEQSHKYLSLIHI